MVSREGVPTSTTTAIIGTRKLISGLGLVPFALLLTRLTDLPSWCLWLIAAYGIVLLGLLVLLLGLLHRRRRDRGEQAPSGGRWRQLAGRMLEGLEPLRARRRRKSATGTTTAACPAWRATW